MQISKEKLKDNLRRQETVPVYTLFGAETYLRDAAAKYIADLCFKEGDLREFNEAEFRLASAEGLASALAAAEQLPMMAERRVIKVSEVRVAAAAKGDTLKEESEPALTPYLDDPCTTSVVIFVADELNGNRKLGKLLKEKTTAVEFERLETAELCSWAADRFKSLGVEADLQTIRHLVDMAGDDLRRLSNEAEKLAAAAMSDGKITRELVDALVPFSRELSNFGLTESLVAGQKKQALRLLKKILDGGAEPLALLGLIASNYRRLLIASEMFARGESRSEIVTAAKAYGAGRDQFLDSARRLDTRKLVAAIERIARADLAIKTSIGGSGNASARLQLEMLVAELALI